MTTTPLSSTPIAPNQAMIIPADTMTPLAPLAPRRLSFTDLKSWPFGKSEGKSKLSDESRGGRKKYVKKDRIKTFWLRSRSAATQLFK